ncbi:MAG: ATP-binding protein [Bacillus sp. (in: Bacteria)]|nr:ATP-binding protein [Bacillus sp. (in: firmicutes)]
MFEPFSRGDKARSTRGGSGLGLSICAKIIRMHGGDIELKRRCADGYTKAFVIHLPA